MSNKKLFWLVFMVLSICEFGQFAYSQNPPVDIHEKDTSVDVLSCTADITIKTTSAVPKQPKCDFRPR
jgi:hypothetical protein